MMLSLHFFLIVVTCLFALVACSVVWQQNNSTFGDNAILEEIKDYNDVPIPGISWVHRIVNPTEVTLDGITYPSAYLALMNGTPRDHPCRNLNAFVNSFLFSDISMAYFIKKYGIHLGHYIVCYLRNFLGAMLVYYGTSMAFHYYYYIHPRSQKIFSNRIKPNWDIIWDQIKLSQCSMIIYVLHPIVDEILVENGYTLCYYTVKEVGGWIPFVFFTLLYFSMVEIGIYWMHRILHTNKFMYNYIHKTHHKYNQAHTLTPWAGLAFDPLDGILQASPYMISLLFVPCHYGLHFIMIFLTAIWATYIHDAMDFNIDPIMGAKYHTVHHTHYVYNYGQVFTFCDRFWGTFREPDGPTGVKKTKEELRKVFNRRAGKKID
mmetsp:Transcript_37720/g.43082  ORF Transcript_37720/g.43082 Transcript_37720/m.43082 type:complete len:376 (-) Transcript_37720:38-1165(-)